MRVLITGASGMIGRKLVAKLLSNGVLNGKPVSKIFAHDVVHLDFDNPIITNLTGDLRSTHQVAKLVEHTPDVIFHLAGIVSSEAEANFNLGYRVNLDGTRSLFDAIRGAKICPRVIFTSSIAVFGAPFPEIIPDDFHLTPLTSYGTQKMIGEALLSDYTRKGIFDGIGIRLPTICVRPGKPNKAASGFFSSIIREPLKGLPATIPVPRDIVHTHASPRAAVNFLIHAAGLNSNLIGPWRNLTMPGVSVTVQEQVDALRAIAGDKLSSLISDAPNAAIWDIVKNWPTRFASNRAKDLGFKAENNFSEIIKAHMEDENISV